MKSTFSYILLFICLPSFAQNLSIKGQVLNANDAPVPFANILVSNPLIKGNGVLTYSITSERGFFLFTIGPNIKMLQLTTTAIGYKEQVDSINCDTLAFITIRLRNTAKALQEVIVKSESLRDTVDVKPDSSTLTGNSTLRDILNKTEGVIISNDGAISFNGKQINKVLINGKEVFINQNKIALDNLNYELMEKVQIINNYTDRFNIDFNSIKNPVINIKTKARFKGVFKLNAEIGLGYEKAYKIKNKGFFFSDNLNTFATSNANNISEKDFSTNDISSSIAQNATDLFKTSVGSFFTDGEGLRKDFNTNNSLTVRNQTNRTKSGLFIVHSNTGQETNTLSTLASPDTLFRDERHTLNRRGLFLMTSINNSYLFNKSTVLNSTATFSILDAQDTRLSYINNFFPTSLRFIEGISALPSVFSIAANSGLTKLLRKKYLLNFAIDYYVEDAKKQSKNSLEGGTVPLDIIQDNHSIKKASSFFTGIEHKRSNLLSLGIGFTYFNTAHTGKLSIINKTNSINYINRNTQIYELNFKANGLSKKIEYAAAIKPSFWTIRSYDLIQKFFLGISSSFSYNFNSTRSISVRYNQLQQQQDISNVHDTIVQAVNQVLLNERQSVNNLSINKNFAVGFYHSNIAKSNSYYLSYNFRTDKNGIYPIFDTIIGNTFYFNNLVLSNRQSDSYNIGASKGFYFTNKYHKIQFRARSSYVISGFPTIIDKQEQNYQSKKVLINADVTLNHKRIFIKEIVAGVNISRQSLRLNTQEINSQKTIVTYIGLSSIGKKIEWKTYFENAIYATEFTKFNILNLNFSIIYKRNDKLSFSLNGKSVLDLFNINAGRNIGLDISSDGNIVNQTINNNRISYIMAKVFYKF
jgi:hypothetical protein